MASGTERQRGTVANPNERWSPTWPEPETDPGPNAPRARYDDICFLSDLIGYAVNSSGRIFKTEDGGVKWRGVWQPRLRIDGKAVWLRCVAFTSVDKGWVGGTTYEQNGHRASLLHTTDGGGSWAEVDMPGDGPPKICGLHAVNESVVYGSGSVNPKEGSAFVKTIDGGATPWTGHSLIEHADNLIDVFFASPDEGWIVGGKATDRSNPSWKNLVPVILYTTDGGLHWTDQAAPIQGQFEGKSSWGWKFQLLGDGETGFVALQCETDGFVLKTQNRGADWTVIKVQPCSNANLEGIGFLNKNCGWVGGWGVKDEENERDDKCDVGNTSWTADGGETWQDVTDQVGYFINRFRFIDDPPFVGYASGATVYKYAPLTTVTAAPSAMESVESDAAPGIVHGHSLDMEKGEAVINYELTSDTHDVVIQIWDRFQKLIRVFDGPDTKDTKGEHTVVWDGTDMEGQRVRPNHFYYRLYAGDEVVSGVMAFR